MVTKSGVLMESRKCLFGIRRHGPPYDPQKPLEAQLDWEGHRLFMNALEAEGFVTQSNRRGTDPYARWWGRGGIARCPPIPIYGAS